MTSSPAKLTPRGAPPPAKSAVRSSALSKKDIWLSFRPSDTGSRQQGGDDTVAKIVRHLSSRGYSVVVGGDEAEGSAEWNNAVQQAIHECDIVVPLCSPGYAASVWKRREVSMAEAAKKTVIPLWHSGAYPPKELEATVAKLPRVPKEGRGLAERPKDFERILNELVVRLERAGCFGSPYRMPAVPKMAVWRPRSPAKDAAGKYARAGHTPSRLDDYGGRSWAGTGANDGSATSLHPYCYYEAYTDAPSTAASGSATARSSGTPSRGRRNGGGGGEAGGGSGGASASGGVAAAAGGGGDAAAGASGGEGGDTALRGAYTPPYTPPRSSQSQRSQGQLASRGSPSRRSSTGRLVGAAAAAAAAPAGSTGTPGRSSMPGSVAGRSSGLSSPLRPHQAGGPSGSTSGAANEDAGSPRSARPYSPKRALEPVEHLATLPAARYLHSTLRGPKAMVAFTPAEHAAPRSDAPSAHHFVQKAYVAGLEEVDVLPGSLTVVSTTPVQRVGMESVDVALPVFVSGPPGEFLVAAGREVLRLDHSEEEPGFVASLWHSMANAEITCLSAPRSTRYPLITGCADGSGIVTFAVRTYPGRESVLAFTEADSYRLEDPSTRNCRVLAATATWDVETVFVAYGAPDANSAGCIKVWNRVDDSSQRASGSDERRYSATVVHSRRCGGMSTCAQLLLLSDEDEPLLLVSAAGRVEALRLATPDDGRHPVLQSVLELVPYAPPPVSDADIAPEALPVALTVDRQWLLVGYGADVQVWRLQDDVLTLAAPELLGPGRRHASSVGRLEVAAPFDEDEDGRFLVLTASWPTLDEEAEDVRGRLVLVPGEAKLWKCQLPPPGW